MTVERRHHPRIRTLKVGRIFFAGLSQVYDCTVRNASATGALLLVPSSAGMPEEFFLYIDKDGTRRPGEIVWRRDDRLGIRFTGPLENTAG